MEGKIRNFLACVIMLVTVYTEGKTLTHHDIEEELRTLLHDVGHLRKTGKEQTEVIKQLQSTVKIQSARITILSETLQNQESVIRKHDNEIEKLKKMNLDLLESLMKETYKTEDVAEEITKIKYKEKTTQNGEYDFGKDNENEKVDKHTSENRIGRLQIEHQEDKLISKPERKRLYNNEPYLWNQTGQVKIKDTEDKFSSKPERETLYNKKPCIWKNGEKRGALSRKYRLLSPGPTQPIPEETIAFYAYMSADMNGIGSHHTLIFDVVKTNEGNGFHGNTGVFIPPKSGLYVFSWTLRVQDGAYHSVELIVNHDVVGSVFQVGSGNYAQGGVTVAVFCNKGDDIYLRTRSEYNGGPIVSNVNVRTSFTGWKI